MNYPLSALMSGVVPESQCQVKREQKKLRDKDKKDYPSHGSPIAEDKPIPISPVSNDVSMTLVLFLDIILNTYYSLHPSDHCLSPHLCFFRCQLSAIFHSCSHYLAFSTPVFLLLFLVICVLNHYVYISVFTCIQIYVMRTQKYDKLIKQYENNKYKWKSVQKAIKCDKLWQWEEKLGISVREQFVRYVF